MKIANKLGKMLRQTGVGIASTKKGLISIGQDIKAQYNEFRLGLKGIDTSKNHIIAKRIKEGA